MYESFYGLKEKPFTLLPDPDYLYLSPKHQRALTLLEYGLMNHAGFSVICGDAGAGKTTLIRRLLAEMGDDTKVGLITNTHQSFGSLLNWVLMAFGLDAEDKTQTQMHQMFVEFLIEQYACNKRTILIVDEAQNMDVNTLEELRMLSNINADKDQVLQVILVGQLALRDTLRKPEMMQFAQRIAVDYYLEPLSETETELYILHRLKVAGADRVIFTPQACKAVYQFSSGTPRLINLLCDTALVYGFAEQAEQIDAKLVTEVVSEQHHNSIIPTFNTQSLNSSARSDKLDKIATQTPGEDPIAELAERVQEAITETPARTETQSDTAPSAAPQTNAGETAAKNQTNHIEAAMENISRKIEEELQNEAIDKLPEEHSPDAADTQPFERPPVDEEPPQPPPEKPHHTDYDDVYPIVHVDEKSSGGKSLAIGLVSGIIISLLLIVIIGYFFIDTLKPQQAGMETSSAMAAQKAELERARLEAIQKERDAALAISKALERERDAALAAAKIQEEIREAEKRAAELVAEQKRKTEQAMKLAQKRAREAEEAAARAREADRIAREKLRQEKLRLEAIRLEKEREALRIKQQQAALAAEKARQTLAAEPAPAPPEVTRPVAVKPDKAVKPVAEEPPKKKKGGFTINPCDSPSAKFLSTCKR